MKNPVYQRDYEHNPHKKINYDNQGDYENAVKINELALSYNISAVEKYQKQLDKVKAKLNKKIGG